MIRNKRVVLRALTEADLKKTVRWFNDQEIVQNLENRLPFLTEEQEKDWYNEVITDPTKLVLAIEAEGHEHIGNIALSLIDYKNRHACISLVIGEKEQWNKGYGTDAVKTLVRFAFQEMGLHKIYTHIIDSNSQSLKLFEKCGFEKEGILRDWYFLKGGYHDRNIMSIIKNQDNSLMRERSGRK